MPELKVTEDGVGHVRVRYQSHGGESVTVSYSISKDAARRIEETAKRNGTSKSRVVQDILNKAKEIE